MTAINLENPTFNDEFATIWRSLNHNQRRFVVQMAESPTKKDAAMAINIDAHTVYNWPKSVDRAVELYHDHIRDAASGIIADSVARAALVKIAGLDSDDERIRQMSSTEILDRYFGKPTQRQEVAGANGGELVINVTLKDDA
jgi:hypothetical protein